MKNKLKVIVIVALLIFIAGSYIALDWSRLFLFPRNVFTDSFPVVKALKLFTSFSCFFLAWTTFTNRVTPIDSLHIKIAFIAVFSGDVAFTFDYPTVGVITFAVGQLLLTVRNSQGIKVFFKNGVSNDDKKYLIRTAVIIGLLNVIVVAAIFYPKLGLNYVFYGFGAYSIVLSVSVWIAWASRKIGYFKPSNAILITIGMTCFYFCDFSVGYGLITSAETAPALKEIVTSVTWMFYAPALVLLAVSAYSFKREVLKS